MKGVTEDEVRDYFKGYGTIDDIEIPRDHITQRAKGYILVEFSKAKEAKEAVDLLNGFEIEGKHITV